MDQARVICLSLFAITIGPWLTVSALRVMTDPSRVRRRSPVNWFIRFVATHHPVYKGNVQFLAKMVFLSGIAMDILALFAVVCVVRLLLGYQ
jgi:hypothetical protein